MVTKLQGLSIVAITLLIYSFIQVGDLDLEPNYACGEKVIKAYCYSLSSSGVTCYTQPDRTGGKQCRGGLWEEISFIPSEIPSETSSHLSGSKRVHCSNKGCI